MRQHQKHSDMFVSIEPLENRRLMSSVSLSLGVLKIVGDTASRNTIDVSLSGDKTKLTATTNGSARTYTASKVTSIRITGGNAGDKITVAAAVTTPATIDGGSGNDIIRGGSGNDTITGGAGADWIDGGPGYDRIDGGPDADTYVNDSRDLLTTGTDDHVVRANPRFTLYDATSFTGKPDSTQYGMKGIILAYSQLFANGDYSKPNEAATRAFARSVATQGKPVVVDIENWPVDIRSATDAQVNDSINKLGQIADWIHSEAPNLKVGFYGIMPLRDYWTPVQYEYYSATNPSYAQEVWLPKYQAWQAANDKLKPLAAKVDFLFPSLYTFYDNQADWKTYAAANIAEAKRYGKPVLPFLWMYYHDSNTKLKGQLIPRDYWQLQLDTVRRLADGVVVWGGWKTAWSGGNADWWTLNVEFVRRETVAE